MKELGKLFTPANVVFFQERSGLPLPAESGQTTVSYTCTPGLSHNREPHYQSCAPDQQLRLAGCADCGLSAPSSIGMKKTPVTTNKQHSQQAATVVL